MRQSTLQIRVVRPDDVEAFRELRLEALRLHPAAFGSDFEESSNDPLGKWVEWVRTSSEGGVDRTFLADAGHELAGMLGVYRSHGVKNHHAGNVWGVYTREKYRGQRVTDRLMEESVKWSAANGIRILRLMVGTHNTRAITCYERCGFIACGTSPEEIRVGDTYYDEILMYRRVSAAR
jgi:ribosomal protein S18 acetylase RimI-like enzyme